MFFKCGLDNLVVAKLQSEFGLFECVLDGISVPQVTTFLRGFILKN
jgi:hypothetical protein